MRTIPILCCIAMAVILAFARASRGEVLDEAIGDPIDDTTEPITGEPLMPIPGSEQPMRDPFTPYDIGGPQAAWRLEDLQADEELVALHGVEDNPPEIQDGHAEAARELAERARAASASNSLQLDRLSTLGVVP